MANYNQNLVSTGLTTTTFVAPIAGPLTIRWKISLPTLTTGGGVSAVVCTVNQQGSPIFTGNAGSEGSSVVATAAALDSFTLVLTSANAVDNALNAVKMNVSISSGQ